MTLGIKKSTTRLLTLILFVVTSPSALGKETTATQPKVVEMPQIHQSFSDIEQWLSRNAPGLLKLLNPPASREQIANAERQLGVKLPSALVAAYAIHDGESAQSDGLFGLWKWLPLAQVCERHNELMDVREDIISAGFNPSTAVPILESGGGDIIYLVARDKMDDPPLLELVARAGPAKNVWHASLSIFLRDFVTKLNNGQYVYRPSELQGLIDTDDL
jgi:hypothetical protein